jgi:hypothetical protein
MATHNDPRHLLTIGNSLLQILLEPLHLIAERTTAQIEKLKSDWF